MNARELKKNIHWMGAIDWDRRLFDSLIPLPDGTSYNAYLIEGSERTALLDTVDPPLAEQLMGQLAAVSKLDYVISHHAEQDHSGAIPHVLERFHQAKVVVTPKAKPILMDALGIPEEAFLTVKMVRHSRLVTKRSGSSTPRGCTGPRRWSRSWKRITSSSAVISTALTSQPQSSTCAIQGAFTKPPRGTSRRS